MSAASQTAAEKRLSFLRRASQDFLNAKLDKTYPKLKLEDLTSNYPLLEDVYKLDSNSYKKLFPNTFVFEHVHQFSKEKDKIYLVCGPKEDAREIVVTELKHNYEKAKYCLSFFWSLLLILKPDEMQTLSLIPDEIIDLNKKYTKRKNIYQFWLELNMTEKESLIKWYNSKTPDLVLIHPYFKAKDLDEEDD